MPYHHPAARIHEIVKAPKALVAGQSVSPKKRGSHGLMFEAYVELVGGSFLDIRYHGVAGVSHDPCWSIDKRPGKRFAMSTFAAPLIPDTVRHLPQAFWQESLEIAKTRQGRDERSCHGN
jgi:hypothetical protein